MAFSQGPSLDKEVNMIPNKTVLFLGNTILVCRESSYNVAKIKEPEQPGRVSKTEKWCPTLFLARTLSLKQVPWAASFPIRMKKMLDPKGNHQDSVRKEKNNVTLCGGDSCCYSLPNPS